MDRTYRPTLIVLFIVTLGGFAFAFITGFSIGRFVVVLPLLVTAYAVTYGRGLPLQLAGFAAAIGLYLFLAWVTPELAHDGDLRRPAAMHHRLRNRVPPPSATNFNPS